MGENILTVPQKKVELLAPAGDFVCLQAAVANGADAIYFGVDQFNARVRAKNFTLDSLPETMAYLHKYGVKGYVTLNILIFEDELEDVKTLVEACMQAGVDGLIVQDLGLIAMIREMSADFPIHGSTQLTLTSAEAIRFLDDYHMEVAVLGRENNLKQIKKISDQIDMPLEVFVHGALCVSYSGQCLTSEVLGGRSANRGECAQACRLPYDLVVDGELKEMGDISYVLSPKDLAAIDLVPELIEAGVQVFKIEGRMKSPEYVANVVQKYRQAIDAYYKNQKFDFTKEIQNELEQSFSRGFTHGFLKGTNHKQLLDGTYPKSRGVYIGKVEKVLNNGVLCRIENPIKRGDGIVFDGGHPEAKEEGGRIFDLRKNGQKIEGEVCSGLVEIIPGRTQVRLKKVKIGQKIWKTNDPALDRALQKTYRKETDITYKKFPLEITAQGEVGEFLVSVWTDTKTGNSVEIQSKESLQKAMKRPLTEAYLFNQWGRLGDTVFELVSVKLVTTDEIILPVKQLNEMRRIAVEKLLEKRMKPRKYVQQDVQVYPNERVYITEGFAQPKLLPLCRTFEQIQAVCESELPMLYCDFEFMHQYPKAVALAHQYGKEIYLATPRVHMPDEIGILKGILKACPDGILVRNLGAMEYFTRAQAPLFLIADYSLNVSNHRSAKVLLQKGAERVTASFDLNEEQVLQMLAYMPEGKTEVVIHQHLPMFHMEHCVYCTFLSKGTDYTNCGKPCERHRVSLKDRLGMLHPVRVDTGCRNTVYNAIEQSDAEYVEEFHDAGVVCFRIEFLEESQAQTKKRLQLYTDLMQKKITGTEVWRALKATNQLGVTRGHFVKANYKEKKYGFYQG